MRASAHAGGVAGPFARHVLGPELGPEALLLFAGLVRAASDKGAALDAPLLARAEAIHRAIFPGGVEALRGAVRLGSGEPLRVRLRLRDAELRKVPWEALAAPGWVRGFLDTSADILLDRARDGDASEERRSLREVRDALRVHVATPDSLPTLIHLRGALQDRIDGGEVVLDLREGAERRAGGEESPEDVGLGANGSDPQDVKGLEGEEGTGETRREGGGPSVAQPGRSGWGVGEAAPGSARVGMITALAEQMTAAVAAGDVEATQVAYEAIGRLLPGLGPGAPVLMILSALPMRTPTLDD